MWEQELSILSHILLAYFHFATTNPSALYQYVLFLAQSQTHRYIFYVDNHHSFTISRLKLSADAATAVSNISVYPQEACNSNLL